MSNPSRDQRASVQPAGAIEESVVYAENHMVAIVDTRDQVLDLVSVLESSGFLESELSVASGPAAADALRESTGRAGFAGLVVRLTNRLGLKNDEGEMKDRYEAALREGHYVIAIFVATDDRKELAAQLLASQGAHFVNFLGRLMIERLAK